MKRVLKVLLLVVMLISVLMLAGCDFESTPTVADNLRDSNEKIAQNQQTLEEKQPAPTMTYSLERQNQIKRAQHINDPNRIGYLYELSDDGKVVNYYVIKG
jgi:Tfp pilus assembly protein PilP